jgi:MYXO-CTERM domain-containing protein
MRRGLVLAGALASSACGRQGPPTEPFEGPSAQVSQREVKLVGALNDARTNPICVPLGDGRVLVAGGVVLPATVGLASAELFSPTDGSPTDGRWRLVTPLSVARVGSAGALLPNGEVFVFGGEGDSALSTSEIYSVATDKWRAGPTAAHARWNHAMFTLLDGRIVVAGGYVDGPPSSSVEIFDPAKGTWSEGPSLAIDRQAPSALRLADGRALVVGHSADARGEVLSADGKLWTPTPPMSTPRVGPALGQLPDGRVVVAGGLDAGGNALSTVELWQPGAAAWIAGPKMGEARGGTNDTSGQRMISLPSGALLIAGGDQGGLPRLFFERLDPGAGAWTDVGDAKYRYYGACVAPYAGGALFTGGYDGESVFATEVYVGAPGGAACTSSDACASGTCAAGRCTAPPAMDAGPADAVADGSPALDAAPPPAIAESFERCAKDAECKGGHCADGVCCDTACRETCHSCTLPGSIGTCRPTPLGLDLRGECGPARSCTGTCSGDGKCVGAATFAQCAAPHCTSISTGVGASYCVASGVGCPSDEAATPFDCAPYVCEPAFGACRGTCVTSNDCVGAYECDVTTKTCVSAAPTSGGGGGGCATGGAGDARGTDAASIPALVLVGLALAGSRRRRRSGR